MSQELCRHKGPLVSSSLAPGEQPPLLASQAQPETSGQVRGGGVLARREGQVLTSKPSPPPPPLQLGACFFLLEAEVKPVHTRHQPRRQETCL